MSFSTAALVGAITCFIIGLRDKDLRPLMFLVSGLAAMAFFVAVVASASPPTPEPTTPRPAAPAEKTIARQPAPPERKYLKVTSVTFTEGHATVIVQGTRRRVPIQCYIQHRLSGDYIATEEWYITTDLVTEVIIGMPDVFSTSSLGAACFEIN